MLAACYAGPVEVYLDGQLVQDIDNMRFRLNNSVKINRAYWTTYYGGKPARSLARWLSPRA
ncbi:MAG: hypothetical protein AAGF11_56045 [Myxococcota bacterium]